MHGHAPQRIFSGKFPIAGSRVCAKQADFIRYRLADEFGQRLAFQVANDAGDYVAFALHGPDYNGFARASRSSAPIATLVFVPVLGEPADESFVNFDNPAELIDIFRQGARTLRHMSQAVS